MKLILLYSFIIVVDDVNGALYITQFCMVLQILGGTQQGSQ